MILFGAEYGFTANLVLNLLPSTPRRRIRVTQMYTQTHMLKLQASVLPESEWCCPSFFTSLPCSRPCLPSSLCLPLSLFLKERERGKSVFGLRPGMMSMPPSAEQRGVSIQSQGSVCAWVCVCVCVCVCLSHISQLKNWLFSRNIPRGERSEHACVRSRKNEVEGRAKERQWGGAWMFAEGSIVLH